jgi:hypothetical protein
MGIDSKQNGPELRFYDALLSRLEHPARSIDLYSISACFGFYSRGMKVFADVLRALSRAARTPAPYGTQLRILIRADDNLIDTFGIERFHAVLNVPSVTIFEMEQPESEADWIQFAIFDGHEVIYTTPQTGLPDDALNLGINKVSPAHAVTTIEDRVRVAQYIELFTRAWNRGGPFEIPRLPTLDDLASRVTRGFPVKKEDSEAGYEKQLSVFLSGLIDRAFIHTQYQIGNHVLDLAIGDPKRRMLAIEVKLASDNESDIKSWKGQVSSYREVVREVILVIVGQGISPQKLHDLVTYFRGNRGVRVVHLPLR